MYCIFDKKNVGKSVGLEKEDALNRVSWRVGATPIYGDKPGSKLDDE